MKKNLLVLGFAAIMAISCVKEKGLASLANQYLPLRLNDAMTEYMGTVSEPVVDRLKVIYNCDSLCFIQGHAVARDAEGEKQEETIRYYLVKDPLMSAMTGKPCYYDGVVGAELLRTKKEIKNFRKKIHDGGSKTFNFFLASAEPVLQLE
ncbi:MAG: hypothetical protein IKW99_07085 [Bacteroidales bacterium]|nr:hypothetical protein [Bacteroidales bacterium]